MTLHHQPTQLHQGSYQTQPSKGWLYVLLPPSLPDEFYSLVYDENNNMVATDEETVLVNELLKLKDVSDVYALCSCNGLLVFQCVSADYVPNDTGFFIWDRAIRDLKRIELRSSAADWGLAWGIGYDHRTSDYKVLRLPEARARSPDPLHIYSLKTNSWSSIVGDFPYWFCVGNSIPIFVNNRIHWLAGHLSARGRRVILYFDAAEEDLGELFLSTTINFSMENKIKVR